MSALRTSGFRVWGLAWSAAFACAVAACGDGDGSHAADAGDTDATQDELDAGADAAQSDGQDPEDGASVADASDEGSEDSSDERAEIATDPPEIRAVNVKVEGLLPIMFDLKAAGARWVLPDPAPARFSVLVRDDVDASEDLEVTVRDGVTDSPVSTTSRSYERGLWQLEVRAEAGSELRVVVTDSSGNETRADYGLTLPSLAEALVGDWQTRSYDAAQKVTERRNLSFLADGHYAATGPGVDDMRGGTYSAEGGVLSLSQRTESGGDGDSDTVEHTDAAAFYVDATYFSPAPYTRVGEGSGHQGTWMRSSLRTEGDTNTEVKETLELSSEGSYSFTREEGDASTRVAGSYVVEPASSYTESDGQFLVRTQTSENGAPATSADTTELFLVRAGRLLVSPYVLMTQ